MTNYQCGSCSYGSDDLDDLQKHLDETGHVGIRKDDAGPTGSKLAKVRVAAEVLGLAALGFSAWAIKELWERLMEAEAEIDYLKSPTGAGRNLKNQDKRYGPAA
ncbi:hypothetical protein [Streptomyces sasae]|uniref:hypothetical protein n=1 Tax=Streptomyces sasae TaxID=1266772 RepID=UPI002931E059|nr:hypothetical protein [Streptomyces sasae]